MDPRTLLRAASPALPRRLNLSLSGEHHSLLPFECLQRLLQCLSLTGSWRWKHISGCLGTFNDLPLGTVLVKADLGAQLGFSHEHPGPAETDKKLWITLSFNQVSQGQTQAAHDIGLYWSPSQEAPENTCPVASFRQYPNRIH